MATTYTATLRIKCWKRHQCLSCLTRFGYQFQRVIKGTGGTEKKAQAAAAKAATEAIQSDVDIEPCPVCGLIQPDMVASRRCKFHFWLNWASLLVPVPIFIGMGHAIPYSTAYGVSAGIGTFLFLMHALAARLNPNRNLAANQAKADAKVEGRRIQVLELGNIPEEPPPFTRGGWGANGLVALGIILAGVLLLMLPEGMLELKGWKENANAFPGVVSEGSVNRYYFKQKFDVVKSFWGVTGIKVTVPAADALDGKGTVRATSWVGDWGNQINVKPSEKNSSITPYIDITAPALKPGVERIAYTVDMTITYPQMAGNNFNNQSTKLAGNFPVEVSPPGAGDTFQLGLIIAGCGGPPLILLGGLLLTLRAYSLARQALPTQITTNPDEPVAPVDPPEEKIELDE